MEKRGLAAVIPALDEEGSVGAVVGELLRRGVPLVLVADNGSRDRTAEVAREAGANVVAAPRRGYGSACRAGLDALPEGTRAVVFCDADGADDLERLDAVVDPVLRGEADLVVGSRTLGGMEPGALSFPQVAGNRVAAALLRLFYRAPATDLGPFRCVSTAVLPRLDLCDPSYGWTAELQAKAYRLGLRVREVPVRARARAAGRSKISGRPIPVLRAGCKIIGTILRLRWERLDPDHGFTRSAEGPE